MKSVTIIHLLFLLTLLFVQELSAQKALYIKPHIGIQSSINHVIQKEYADPDFRIYTLHVNPDMGIQLQYEHEKWSYYAGISANVINMDIGTGSSRTVRSSGVDIIRFPIGIQKNIKTIGLIELNKRPRIFPRRKKVEKYELLYVFLFDLKVDAGISLDYLPFSLRREPVFFRPNVHIQMLEGNNKLGYSIYGGLTFQFFNYTRKHFQLSFLYSQGINRKFKAEVDYTINNNDYSAIIGSRSSFFGVQLAYPFKLISFRSKIQE